MRPIPKKMREDIAADPFMEKCVHLGCPNPVEWEHALIYAGKQVNEPFAIVPCCYHHHRGEGLDKDFNRWVALNRMKGDDWAKYGRSDWEQKKASLDQKYGSYDAYLMVREDPDLNQALNDINTI